MYQPVVKNVQSLIESINGCDAKAGEIKRTIAAIEKEKANWLSTHLSDPEALRKISDSRLIEELAPKQLEAIDVDKARFVEELKHSLSSLEGEIANLRTAERDRLIDQISPELSKKYCGGNSDAARSIAASLPIVTVIGLNSTWSNPNFGADRVISPKSHDELVLSHARQLVSILDRYESNDCSFIPPNFTKAA